MDNNTVSENSTHFLKGVELIEHYMQVKYIASENWSYPTSTKSGDPNSEYYAEIWTNGMDYNYNYFLIETFDYKSPKCILLFHFPDDTNMMKQFDFKQMCTDILRVRRYKLTGIKDKFQEIDFLLYSKLKEEGFLTNKVIFSHASHKPVEFLINKEIYDFIKYKGE